MSYFIFRKNIFQILFRLINISVKINLITIDLNCIVSSYYIDIFIYVSRRDHSLRHPCNPSYRSLVCVQHKHS